jgi:hypothetical protein
VESKSVGMTTPVKSYGEPTDDSNDRNEECKLDEDDYEDELDDEEDDEDDDDDEFNYDDSEFNDRTASTKRSGSADSGDRHLATGSNSYGGDSESGRLSSDQPDQLDCLFDVNRASGRKRKKKKKKKKLVVVKRSLTNTRERWRQQNVNDAFLDLRKLVPTYPPDKKLSKNEILRLAIKYINTLMRVLEYQKRCELTNAPQSVKPNSLLCDLSSSSSSFSALSEETD